MYHMLKMINPFTSRLHLHYPDEFSLFQLDFTWQKSWLVVRLKKAKINHDFKLFKSSSLALNVSSNLPQSTAYLLLSLCIPFWRLLHRNPFSVKWRWWFNLLATSSCYLKRQTSKANVTCTCCFHCILHFFGLLPLLAGLNDWSRTWLYILLLIMSLIYMESKFANLSLIRSFWVDHHLLSADSLHSLMTTSRGKESSHSHDSARA